jgi:hypothetical protein
MRRILVAGLLCVALIDPRSACAQDDRDDAVVLYLRAYNTLLLADAAATHLATAAIARVPGLRLQLFIDPEDRAAVPLAEALVSLPDDRTRLELIQVLESASNHRFEADAIEGALRTLGRGTHGRSNDPNRRFRIFAAAAASPEARVLLRRPSWIDAPGQPFAALGEVTLSPQNIWNLTQTSAAPPVQSKPRGRISVGLAPHTVAVRFPTYASTTRDRACALLETAGALAAAGRVTLRLRVDMGPGDPPALALLSRALQGADPARALVLARTVCSDGWPEDEASTIAMLEKLQMSPNDVARVTLPPTVTDPSNVEMFIDEVPANSYELNRLWELPMIRSRMNRRRP